MTYWPRTLTRTGKYICCYARLAMLHVAFYAAYAVDSAFPVHQITSNVHKTMANRQNNDHKIRCLRLCKVAMKGRKR